MQAQVEQWIDFTTQEIDAPMLSWFLPIIGYMEYNKKVCPLQQYLSLSLQQDCSRKNAVHQIVSKARNNQRKLLWPCNWACLSLTATDLFMRQLIYIKWCSSAEGGGSS